MHARNIFKHAAPKFEELSKEFPEFSPYVQRGASGKTYVNFKDPASLRALSKVLLKKYFNIVIDVPLDRLIPTIPLRLNYIHWIEDLVDYKNNEDIVGFDVGCGASCVYPLLGNKMNGWKFIATEIDSQSMEFAVRNVEKNSAGENIKVVLNEKDKPVFAPVLNQSCYPHINFTMCNPPFFEEIHDDHKRKDRTNHRPPPASVNTASENESVTCGGEVKFVCNMVEESLCMKEKVSWYTTMLGRKSSLKTLLKYLKQQDIEKVVTTEFKQGRTMRWGLAWTFTENIDKVPKKEKKEKKSKPFYLSITQPFFEENDISMVTKNTSSKEKAVILWDVCKIISNTLTDLRLSFESPEYVILLNKDAYEITGTASENTWTHQRKKRRENKRIETFPNMTGIDSASVGLVDSAAVAKLPSEVCNEANHSHLGKRKISNSDSVSRSKKFKSSVGESQTASISSIEEKNVEEKNVENLFTFSVTIAMSEQYCLAESDLVTVSFLCLHGNRDLFHQLFLYFKNCIHGRQLCAK